MNLNNEFDSTKEPSSDVDLGIDRICDEFELSYQRNERPRIEDYLDETLGDVETQLVELVMVELAYRKKAGDTPTIDEYVSRFPTFSDALKELSDHFQSEIATGFRPPPPPQIQNLEAFEFIGAGAFGAVWKAWDTILRRFVAVKVPIRPVPTQTDRELIQREASVVARAKHPYVVPVYATGEKDGQVYVVYEFVPGTTLRQRLKLGSFTPKAAAALCAKIADAIEHVHQLGIVHRDLKPANILIDFDEDPHVMDFGLAKLIDTTSTIGASGNPLGTPAYMSPEQAAGRSTETDPRSDIYSLGVILFELVAGKPVFQGDHYELTYQILNVPPPRLSSVVPGIGKGLERICDKCLEKNKLDRFESAAQLATQLRRFVYGQEVQVRPVPLRVRGWRWLKQHKLSAVLAVVALIPLLAFLLPKPDPPPAGSRPVIVTTDPPGAAVIVSPCDSTTGEADLLKYVTLNGTTPGQLNLLPGRYLVHAALAGPRGVQRLEVHRTVPGGVDTWPSRSASWETSPARSTGEIEWHPLSFPTTPPPVEMALIEGTKQFVIEGPDGPRTVEIAPFFVATREFTFGDFLILRPGRNGNTAGKEATKEPPQNTMASRYDWAEHWAEATGCRLLTDLEFAYLAHLAAEAQANRPLPANSGDTFDVAGGSGLDEISTTPPVRGILTGYAEWTSTWPRSPRATVDLSNKIDIPDHPELFRIVRGGTINNSSQDYPRNQLSADVSGIYIDHPHIGFRLARTPEPGAITKEK